METEINKIENNPTTNEQQEIKEPIEKIIDTKNTTSIPNSNKQTYTKNNSNNNNKSSSIFSRIIIPQIRKQIEFYFSDKNYYKDNFLLEKAAEDGDNCKKYFLISINFF